MDGAVHTSDRTLAFQLLHWHATQRLLAADSLVKLLTGKLMAVEIGSLVENELTCFWMLFHCVFQVVSSCVSQFIPLRASLLK